MKKSLYWKILSGYLAVTIVTLLVIYAIATNFIRTQTIQRVEDELKAHSKIIALMKTTDVQNNIHSISNATGCRITVVDVHGNVLADTSAELPLENHYNRPEIVEARFKEFGTAVRYSNTLNYDVLYVAIVKQEQGKQINYLRLAKPLANIKASMNKLHNAIFYTAGIAIIPCLLIALFFFMKLIKPIRKIDEYTNQVLSGENPESLRVDSEDEIGNLAKNVNTMFLSQRDKIMQLEEQKQKLAATFANMNEGVMLLNSKQEIETINESMARILNKQREEIIGKTPIEVLRSNKLHDAISRCLIIKETAVIEIVTDDENSTFLEISISSIDNAVVGKRKTIVVFRDVTSLKKLEQSRSDFVANVAHELKTPITAIAGFSQTLLEGVAETNKQKDFLQKINSNSMRLNRLVDDLLTLFELEFGKTHLDITPIPICNVVNEAVSLFASIATEKGLLIINNLQENSTPILADKDKAFHAVANILSNAVKFTPSGQIEITSIMETNFFVLSISDTGTGIPAHDIPRLGERFYRADKARSRQFGSTGLGLSIVKHTMQLLNGQMEIESVLGTGTTVRLFFPTSKNC